jgi:hypothetical protein
VAGNPIKTLAILLICNKTKCANRVSNVADAHDQRRFGVALMQFAS